MQAKILKLLPNLQEQRGSGIFFITPGIALGRKVNGRIAIMLDGKIIEEGPSNHNVAAYYGFRLNINSKVLSIVQYRPLSGLGFLANILLFPGIYSAV